MGKKVFARIVTVKCAVRNDLSRIHEKVSPAVRISVAAGYLLPALSEGRCVEQPLLAVISCLLRLNDLRSVAGALRRQIQPAVDISDVETSVPVSRRLNRIQLSRRSVPRIRPSSGICILRSVVDIDDIIGSHVHDAIILTVLLDRKYL